MTMLEGRSLSELIRDGVKHLGRFNTIFAQLMHQSGSKVDKLMADLMKSQNALADVVKDAQLWEKKAHTLEGNLYDTKNRLRNAEGCENSLKVVMESLKMERTYLKLQLKDAQHQQDVAVNTLSVEVTKAFQLSLELKRFSKAPDVATQTHILAKYQKFEEFD